MLVNQYRSLSLMQGEDIQKYLERESGAKDFLGQVSLKDQMQQDLDEISSIQTAHEACRRNVESLEMTIRQKIDFKKKQNNNIEKPRFSIMNEGDLNDIMNMNKILEFGCGFNEGK